MSINIKTLTHVCQVIKFEALFFRNVLFVVTKILLRWSFRKTRKMLIINGQHIRLSLKSRLLLPPRLNIPQTKKPQILFYFHLRRVTPGDHADAVILGFP